MKSLNVKGGVLIIGSLLWQDYLVDSSDGLRQKWRSKYLALEDKISVKSPIRYGRMSNNGIYTMVFCTDCIGEKLGDAFVVPFRNKDGLTSDHLVELTIELSKAEGMSGNFVAGRRDPWAAIGLLINEKTDASIKVKLRELWGKQYSNEQSFDNLKFRVGSEQPSILPNGMLNQFWPTTQNSKAQAMLDTLDFVVTTVTKPTDYPDISKLVENVNSDSNRRYFFNNIANGINTFQDSKVLELLKKS
jgi:hypothetical protein